MNTMEQAEECSSEDLAEVLVERYYERVLELYRRSFSGLVSKPVYLERMSRDALDPRRSRAQLDSVEQMHDMSLAGKRVLEVGSGLGLTVAVARLEYRVAAIGIEPGSDEYDGSLQIARDMLATCGLPPDAVVSGVGESLPFEDASFDAVISSNVLEHVRDPAAVIRESIRVLRPGGILHFVVPNYGSWWEGHYGVPWLPNMPLWLARIYIGTLGRDVSFLDTLQFVNCRMMERIVAEHQGRVRVLGWGTQLWEHRLRTLDFAEYHTLDKLKYILRIMHKIGAIDLLITVGKRLRWETPIVLRLERTA